MKAGEGKPVPSVDHGFRRSYKNKDEFARGIDYENTNDNVAERMQEGNLLFARRFEQAMQILKDSNIIQVDGNTLIDESGVSVFLYEGMGDTIMTLPETYKGLAVVNKINKLAQGGNKVAIAQQIILGYMMTTDSADPLVGMVLNLDDDFRIDVEAFNERYNKDNALVKAYAALKHVENVSRGSIDYVNPFYTHARSFVLNGLTAITEDSQLELEAEFVQYLQDGGHLSHLKDLTQQERMNALKQIRRALYDVSVQLGDATHTYTVPTNNETESTSELKIDENITGKQAHVKLSNNFHTQAAADMITMLEQ